MSPFGPSIPGGPFNRAHTQSSYILSQSQCWSLLKITQISRSFKVHVVFEQRKNILWLKIRKVWTVGHVPLGRGYRSCPGVLGLHALQAESRKKYHRVNSEYVMTSLSLKIRCNKDTNHVLAEDFSEGLSLVGCFWGKICLQLTQFKIRRTFKIRQNSI